MKEIYKDIKGYEGLYQVSNLGNVKSLDRTTLCIISPSKYQSRQLKTKTPEGKCSFTLYKNGKKTHIRSIGSLIIEAFPHENQPKIVNTKEIYKDIKGFEGLYQISNIGNVKSSDREVPSNKKSKKYSGKQLSKLQSNGYFSVALYKFSKRKQRTIASLVIEAFLYERPNGLVVDHIDNNPSNNRIDNLQYLTNKENSIKDKNPITGITGVYLYIDSYKAMISFNRKQYYLGRFETKEEAQVVYLEAEKNRDLFTGDIRQFRRDIGYPTDIDE